MERLLAYGLLLCYQVSWWTVLKTCLLLGEEMRFVQILVSYE